MALSDPKTRRQMTQEQFAFLNALIGDAKISHQDTWVRLKVGITPEMLGETSSPSPTSTPASPK
jgi:hypothetical protein